MRIIYSAGNRRGANVQLFRFINKISTNHNIKIAAYLNSSYSFSHIDWTLDSLHNKYSNKKISKLKKLINSNYFPIVSVIEAELFLRDIDNFEPDLIICDGEQISALIAQALGIRLWYCSPLLLLTAFSGLDVRIKYRYLLENIRKITGEMPDAERYFIYSPFEILQDKLNIDKKYEWIKPYYYSKEPNSTKNNILAVTPNPHRKNKIKKILNCSFDKFSLFSHDLEVNLNKRNKYKECLYNADWFFTTGETSYLSDAIYNNVKKICIAPDLTDMETLINASLIRAFNLGHEAAQIELMDKYSLDEITKSLNTVYTPIIHKNKQGTKTLDERINELCM